MRKYLFMIPLMLVSFIAFAQDGLENFKIEGRTIVWQKVYEFPLEDSAKVANFFYSNASFIYNDNVGVCYYELGYKTNLKPMQMSLLLREYSRLKFVVQIKEDKYRVTVLSLEPVDSFVKTNLGKDYKDKVYMSNFFEDKFFKKDGSLQKSFYANAPYINEALIKIFNYYNGTTSVLDDDF